MTYQLIQTPANKIPLPDESVQCVVTSPPYWGLRKYDGSQDLLWGGSSQCEHEWTAEKTIKSTPQRDHDASGNFGVIRGTEDSRKEIAFSTQLGNTCTLCGAWRGGFGLEPSLKLYIEHTVEILRELKRILKSDGVIFWNVGDSYAGSGKGPSKYAPQHMEFEHRPELYSKSMRIPRGSGRWGGGVYTENKAFDGKETDRETHGNEPNQKGTRNMRNVWTFATQPFKGAHFATFPEELPRRCIRAATKIGDTVLDPFCGSGTTGKVALELGRNFIGTDLAYQEIAEQRIQKAVLQVPEVSSLCEQQILEPQYAPCEFD